MHNVTILRRKKLGRTSVSALLENFTKLAYQQGQSLPVQPSITGTGSLVREIALPTQDPQESTGSSTSTLVRWGCVTQFHSDTQTVLNTAQSITNVNNKLGFRRTMLSLDYRIPVTKNGTDSGSSEGINCLSVLRPSKHSQGKNLWLVSSLEEVLQVVREHPRVFAGGWYTSEFVQKTAEYRVFVVSGRVASVARKTPGDPSAVAWNVAQGGRFDNVRWGDWPMNACEVAIEAFRLSGLDFGGVDVMIDEEGNAFVIEINSAPSLPNNSDGSPTYRQECMSKALYWAVTQGKEWIEPEGYSNWRQVIHPSIQEYSLG